MIMASIESAFDMEAAIPQIIEKSIYEAKDRSVRNVEEKI